MTRWAALGRVAISILVLTAGACGEDGAMFERQDDVQEVADGLRDALGLEQVHADAHHRRTEPGCAAELGLAEEDAWYERNTFQVADSGLDPDEVYDRTLAYLVDAGYQVDELRAPLSDSRGLRAIHDDVGVLIDLVGDGANMTVTAGPCAVELSPVRGSYEVVGTAG